MKRRRVRVRTGPKGISYWGPLLGSCSLLRAPFSAWEAARRRVGSHRPYLQRWGFSGPGCSPDRTLASVASGHLNVSGAVAVLPRRLFTTPLLSASPHCSVLLTTPLLSASPHCSVLFTILFSAPLLTALSLPCGPCGFPYPCWLPSSVPCGCSLSWAESLAFAGLAAALLQMPLVSSCPPPCRSCLPAALVLSASGVRALQRQEGFTSLVFSVSRFIEEKTAALK